jgi:hypothetical protein
LIRAAGRATRQARQWVVIAKRIAQIHHGLLLPTAQILVKL